MYKADRCLAVASGALMVVLQACSGTPSGGDGNGAGTGGTIAAGGSSAGGTGGRGGSSGGGLPSGSGGSGAQAGSGGTGSNPGSGGQSNPGSGGQSNPGSGGTSAGGTGGTGPTGTGGNGPGPDASNGDVMPPTDLPKFSFFVTSLEAMRKLSGNQQGFGGDLTFGKADGLSGADEICRQTAELGMTGAGQKQWRAFLSTTTGGANGGPVHAIDRLGNGPWYDRLGRLVAMTKADLLNTRPKGADPAIINDLPNEHGVPNHAPDPGKGQVDNHDMLTGTNAQGMLYRMDKASTCNDWTSKAASGKPWCGHAWPRRGSGENWMSALAEGGCAPGVNLIEMGGPSDPNVGSGGGYGGIYCFASTP
jgi:hypothetical protein